MSTQPSPSPPPPPPPQQTYDSNPKPLLSALLTTIENDIIPKTSHGVQTGSKLFGAAILSKETLTPLTVSTNNEASSPLLHGEINCIQEFFAQTSFPSSSSSSSSSSTIKNTNTTTETETKRPSTKSCIFLATHEPCSLCLSGITWSGFDNFFYLFTYEDSRDLFSIPYDIDILQQVFRVPAVSSSSSSSTTTQAVDEDIDARPLYNKRNKFFTARSLNDLVREIAEKEGEEEAKKWEDEIRRVKDLYNGLSDTYQKGKAGGVESASFWK
ncbi:cytidine deoxycytidylate deaminase family protein [Poronia punctata]|nr:cytidine deoxycytidylate deaminase family protein [Poronia punctata]